MGLNTQRGTRIVYVLATAVLAAAGYDTVALRRDLARNAVIAAAQAPEGSDVPELRFARAHAQAASGAAEAALNGYRALQADPRLGAAARYNSANLLLRQAIALRAGDQPGQALPLIELAKEQYRELLRKQPQDWAARYNLERAQRLLPDPEDVEFDATAVPRARERAATTMRAQTLGLP